MFGLKHPIISCAICSACITVKPRKDIVASEVRHQYSQKGYAQICGGVFRICEPRNGHLVQRIHIYKKCYQCPCLLWIPLPKSPPGCLCPYSSKDDACSKEQFGGNKHAAVGTEGEQGEEAVGEYDGCDMRTEPRAIQCRHDGSDMRVERAKMRYHQCGTCYEQCGHAV